MFAAIPLWAKALAVVLALAALLGVIEHGVHSIEATGEAKAQAAQARQFQEDVATARSREQAIQFRQEASDHDVQRIRDVAAVGGSHLDRTAGRLQHTLGAVDVGCVPGDSAASAAEPAASAAAYLRAQLRRRAGEVAGQLDAVGRFADSANAAALGADGQYDALSPSAPAR